MKGLIIASGSISDYTRLELLIKESDCIVAADGGVKHLLSINRDPNLLIGDLDSISESSLEYIKSKDISIIEFPSMKDSTDTQLAMEHLIDLGYKDITLTGVTGTRLDHTLANVYLLNRLSEMGIKGRIVDDNNTIYLAEKSMEIQSIEDANVSIIPITMTGINITLLGFAYDLNREFIDFASSKCVSNRIVADKGIIKLHKGKALVFISKD